MTCRKSLFPRILYTVLGMALMGASACHGGDSLSAAREMFDDYHYAAGLVPLRQAAEAGDLDARRTLGLMLLHGETVYGAEVPGNRE